MTSPAKRKGASAELELARILADLTGWKVRRKLGAGRSDDTGDLDGIPSTTVQVKNFADVLRGIREGLADLEVQQRNAGTTHGVLFVRRRGGDWLAVQTVAQWATTMREAVG